MNCLEADYIRNSTFRLGNESIIIRKSLEVTKKQLLLPIASGKRELISSILLRV